MNGEQAGPAAPKVLRLIYFVGAGFLCTAAINKWRELERKAIRQKKDRQLLENPAKVVD